MIKFLVKKSRKIILFVIIAVLFLVSQTFILWPRVSRCIIYHKLIASDTYMLSSSARTGTHEVIEVSRLTTLALEPEIIDLPPFDSKPNISFGYAQCYIDPNLINMIRYPSQGVIIIKISEHDEYSFGFFNPPEYDFSFEDELKAIRTYPKSYFQICCMTEEEFSEYMARCIRKTLHNKYNANGFGIFENDNIKGIVRFGEARGPARMYVSVYSKKYSINQVIMVGSSSPEKTRKIIFSLLSSYRYLADRPEDKSALKQMVSDSVSQHPKFQPDAPDEGSKDK